VQWPYTQQTIPNIAEGTEEARAIAVKMTDMHTKATMLAIAQDYEKLGS
jgi:hypothetical protein